jgi:hypothetical protein
LYKRHVAKRAPLGRGWISLDVLNGLVEEARIILESYIEEGCSMEVNISDVMKNAIRTKFETISNNAQHAVGTASSGSSPMIGAMTAASPSTLRQQRTNSPAPFGAPTPSQRSSVSEPPAAVTAATAVTILAGGSGGVSATPVPLQRTAAIGGLASNGRGINDVKINDDEITSLLTLFDTAHTACMQLLINGPWLRFRQSSLWRQFVASLAAGDTTIAAVHYAIHSSNPNYGGAGGGTSSPHHSRLSTPTGPAAATATTSAAAGVGAGVISLRSMSPNNTDVIAIAPSTGATIIGGGSTPIRSSSRSNNPPPPPRSLPTGRSNSPGLGSPLGSGLPFNGNHGNNMTIMMMMSSMNAGTINHKNNNESSNGVEDIRSHTPTRSSLTITPTPNALTSGNPTLMSPSENNNNPSLTIATTLLPGTVATSD